MVVFRGGEIRGHFRGAQSTMLADDEAIRRWAFRQEKNSVTLQRPQPGNANAPSAYSLLRAIPVRSRPDKGPTQHGPQFLPLRHQLTAVSSKGGKIIPSAAIFFCDTIFTAFLQQAIKLLQHFLAMVASSSQICLGVRVLVMDEDL